MKKTYSVRVTYTGEKEAEDKDELEEKLWVLHTLFGKPYEDYLFEAEEVDIQEESE